MELEKVGINSRRYFYPSLNTLPFLQYQPCPVSEEIAKRVLCLPLHPELKESEICKISNIVRKAIWLL
jgi:dTDP-4-amino-4,6-dideoxygalactose transaminase